MQRQANPFLRAFGFVIAGGLIVGLVSFLLSSVHTPYSYLGGPGIRVISGAGFDAWTGLPHGATIEYEETSISPAVAPHTEDVPAELRTRRAIPVPVGIVVGSSGALAILLGYQRGGRGARRRPVAGDSR